MISSSGSPSRSRLAENLWDRPSSEGTHADKSRRALAAHLPLGSLGRAVHNEHSRGSLSSAGGSRYAIRAVAGARPHPACDGRRARPRRGPAGREVRKSIDDGRRYLLGQRRESGSWEIGAATVAYPGGATSLVLLALLTAGVPPSDPVIQDGLKYLRTIELEPGSKTYVVGLQTMAYSQAGQAVDRERIQKNTTWLQDAQKANGWSYGRLGDPDNSNTQYAVLGLHAGIESGVRVDKRALENIRRFMVDSQIPKAIPGRPGTGGWAYKERNPPSMTMTCAGLSNLMITGMDLDVSKQRLEGGVIKDCGLYDEEGPAANGLRWIGGAFPDELQAGNAATRLGPAQFYALYGIERTGRLTGRRFLGGHDWYEIGCRYLVSIQKGDGSWQGLGNLDGAPVVATSFALLFLAKGRTPVLITKLAYGPRDYDGWNNKHSDARQPRRVRQPRAVQEASRWPGRSSTCAAACRPITRRTSVDSLPSCCRRPSSTSTATTTRRAARKRKSSRSTWRTAASFSPRPAAATRVSNAISAKLMERIFPRRRAEAACRTIIRSGRRRASFC